MSELSRDARAVIDAARHGDEPAESDRRRLRAALLLQIGGGTAASTLIAATTKAASAGTSVAPPAAAVGAGAGILSKKIVIAIAIAAGGGGGFVAWHQQGPASQSQGLPALVSTVDDAPWRKSVAPPDAPEPVAPPRAALAPSAEASAPVPNASAPPRPASPDQLEAELGLLRAAQRELAAGNADRALELLDAHQRGFENGAMGQERRAARVIALCQAGRVAEARAEAARFLQQSPRSPLAARVRSACQADE
jgi:hypothetical protein